MSCYPAVGRGGVALQPSGGAEPSPRGSGEAEQDSCLLGQEIQPCSREFLPFDGALIPPLWGTSALGPRQHPIANDAFAAGLASKVIYYSVNCNIRVNFCLKFLPPQSTLAPAVEAVPTSAKMFFCPLDLPIRRPRALPQESSRAGF